jgi:hypothetical protein
MNSSKKPGGDITTLLDLATRDRQDNDFFPLQSMESWFTRDPERRHIPMTPLVSDFPFRGPASFGQRFTFDIGSVPCGDVLFGAALQIQLGHWFEPEVQLFLQSKRYTYDNSGTAWFYANSLGSSIIEKAELEIDGKTIEEIDGDFIHVFSRLFPELNTQFGTGVDHFGRVSVPRLLTWDVHRIFPTENGYIHCILPFFFMRTRYQEALPMIAIREGLVKIHITLRKFEDCIRQRRGFRDTCTSTPLDTQIQLYDNVLNQSVSAQTSVAAPQFASVRLLTMGALLNGKIREAMLRQPFEILHREVQTFWFTEPLKYLTAKNSSSDTIRIGLPLEANHPLEEILWFVRRKDVNMNNEWVNYSSVLEKDYNLTYNPPQPLLISASIQVNGITICDAEEIYYRELIARHHKGGIVSFVNYIYGYPFAREPGKHQPSGTLNASRVQSLKLNLEVKSVPGVEWEVKVFCCALNWLRFQNGMANSIFED